MASAAFHFDAQASLVKVAVTPGGTTTATIDDTSGIASASWALVYDENGSTGWGLSTTTGSSTVVTVPSIVGRAAILQCTANGGVSTGVDGTSTTGDLVKTALVYTAPEVGVIGETSESDAVYGYIAKMNNAIRAVGGGGYRPRLLPLTPAQITADQNNYAPSGLANASVLRLSSDAARNVTGLSSPTTSDVLWLCNVGSFTITLKHENASSTAANRFTFPSAADKALVSGGSCALWYDLTTARWRILTAVS
jgi:hypothetical protein